MTKYELNDAVTIAMDTTNDLSDVDFSVFYGYGLREFKPITATRRQVAALIRWDALQFNGEIDGEALNQIATRGRKLFQIAG